jgi:hydroxymethylglutaryl-CoA lyase
MAEVLKIIECPRDAMQGWPHFIGTNDKLRYLRSLLSCGFNTLDCGSFVSPKAIPQMADSADVLGQLVNQSPTRLLAIVANLKGAENACAFSNIQFLGFPFSVSPTFQLKNTNSTMLASLERVREIQALCLQHGKELVVYLSMAFGNPYGDPYSEEEVQQWGKKIADMGIKIISLADTVGVALPEQVHRITGLMISELPAVEIGVHLHSTSQNRNAKLEAAFTAGCRRFDGALKGIGGCPMAGNELVGNMDTEWMIDFFEANGIKTGVNFHQLKESLAIAGEIFI